MNNEGVPAVDAAGVAALLAAANAPIPADRHRGLVDAVAHVVAAGRRLAAAGVDRLAPLTPCAPLQDG